LGSKNPGLDVGIVPHPVPAIQTPDQHDPGAAGRVFRELGKKQADGPAMELGGTEGDIHGGIL
jgi:hypothetical protein